MNLYLDEDLSNPALVRALGRAGHDVQRPADVGLLGKADAVQFAHAIRQARTIVTRNYDDFEALHELLLAAAGRHFGILVIREDNNRRRDMKTPDIVRALRNLEASGLPMADEYHVLNHYR
jgi:predicted nuclease of predicted toxin-antitoxin system